MSFRMESNFFAGCRGRRPLQGLRIAVWFVRKPTVLRRAWKPAPTGLHFPIGFVRKSNRARAQRASASTTCRERPLCRSAWRVIFLRVAESATPTGFAYRRLVRAKADRARAGVETRPYGIALSHWVCSKIQPCSGGAWKVSPAGSVALLHTSVCRGLHRRPAPTHIPNLLCGRGDSSPTAQNDKKRHNPPKRTVPFLSFLIEFQIQARSIGTDSLSICLLTASLYPQSVWRRSGWACASTRARLCR